MGEPATPTPAERDSTLELARAIVESVRCDEPMPAMFHKPEDLDVVRTVAFRLAQDLVDSRAILDTPDPAYWPKPEIRGVRPTHQNPTGVPAMYWAPLGETLPVDEWRAILAMLLRGCDRAESEARS